MREWHLQREKLPKITLAADARLCTPNYYDDQIWEVSLSEGEPTGLSIQTTYGLRARGMRMFPKFSEEDTSVINPSEFHQPPAIHRFFTNYLLLTFSPFNGIDVVSEYWVPESNIVTGRIRVINSGVIPRKLSVAWIVSLIPGEEGEKMTPETIDSSNILKGKVNNIVPVVFMTGGPTANHSPYPNLSLQLDLLPGLERKFLWAHAALPTVEESFSEVRKVVKRNWDGESTKIELTNSAQIDIYTGDPDWDLAFALGQQVAYGLLVGTTEKLPYLSFVQKRRPEQGFSFLGDGTDYDYTWSGQSPLETWYLCQQFLPSSPQIAMNFLRNFLAVQKSSGFIDWRPGLNGKQSGLNATPLLADLAWRIFEVTKDSGFLVEVFHPLLDFLFSWVEDNSTETKIQNPIWEHPLHTGFEDNPLFDLWQPWSQGADITLFDHPSLWAFLIREFEALLKITRELNQSDAEKQILNQLEKLREALSSNWNESTHTFGYQDHVSHTNPRGKTMGFRKGPGQINLGRFSFSSTTRLSLKIDTNGGGTRQPIIQIEGKGPDNKLVKETIETDKIRWPLGMGLVVSDNLYLSFDSIEISNIEPEDQVKVFTVDYQHHDQTLLLPLWAHALSRKQAKTFIRKNIVNPNKYWQSYGLRACATCPNFEANVICDSVWMPWNSLIGEGMLAFDETEFVIELISRLLDAIIMNIQKDGTFRKYYHAKTGEGIGDQNSVLGLPPIGLFLAALGVEIIDPWKVKLSGTNPFPWPVKIKFKGLTIKREENKTTIIFPSGQSVNVPVTSPCIVDGKGIQQIPQQSKPSIRKRFRKVMGE